MTAVMPYIGEQLKRLRLRNALTQRQLAEQAGLTLRSVNQLETNKTEPRPTTLRKLADALGATPADLLGD